MKFYSFLNRNILTLTFITIFLFLFFFMGYNELISLSPCSIHAWRQSDSYSFALTYYYENNKFLEPSILFIGEDGNGKAVSEFPLLYYLTAKIWKITGVTPAILKFINFAFLITGLYHLLILSKKILKDNFWSICVVLLVFSSPLLGYYSFNFIPNIPAFGLALSGLYFIYMYALTSKNKYLITFTLLFIIAVLIKVTAFFSLLGAIAVLFLYFIEDWKKYKVQIMAVTMSLIIIFSVYWIWYKYSLNYNSINLKGIFNQSVMPIWNLELDKIQEILTSFNRNVFHIYFNKYASLLFSIIIIFLFLFKKKFNKHARRLTLIYFLGLLSFSALFFRGLNKHDYFLINTLIIIPVIFTTFILALKDFYLRIYKSKIVKIIVLIFLIMLINNNMIITRSHYNPNSKLVKYNLPLKKKQRDFWDYNYHVIKYYDYQFMDIDKYLRKIGIDYDNMIITIGDFTPNKTLSIMHLKGFSEYHYSWNYEGAEMIERMKSLGAEYLIVCGNNYKEREYLTPYLENQIGKYNDTRIFKLKNY